MRNATLTGLVFVAFGLAANAQKITLLPTVGLDFTKIKLEYNGQKISPLGWATSPQLGARLNMQCMEGHGSFVGLATNRSIVNYHFSNPETGMNEYTASKGDVQLRFEGGYQYSSRPIYFSKNKSSKSTPAYSKNSTTIITEKRCGSYTVRSQCIKNKETKTATKNKGWYVSLQPYAGAAMVSNTPTNVVTKSGTYEYRAGNWNKAIMAGSGFEFGRGRDRMFTVSLNYLRGIGNNATETFTTVSGAKTTTTHLKSNASSWNMSVGVPLTLYKTKSRTKTEVRIIEKKSVEKYQAPKKGCGYYKPSCRKAI